MSEIQKEMLAQVCRQLRLGSGLVSRAYEMTGDSHPEFLLNLLSSEVEERDRKRRNLYLSQAKFELIKTFENYVRP